MGRISSKLEEGPLVMLRTTNLSCSIVSRCSTNLCKKSSFQAVLRGSPSNLGLVGTRSVASVVNCFSPRVSPLLLSSFSTQISSPTLSVPDFKQSSIDIKLRIKQLVNWAIMQFAQDSQDQQGSNDTNQSSGSSDSQNQSGGSKKKKKIVKKKGKKPKEETEEERKIREEEERISAENKRIDDEKQQRKVNIFYGTILALMGLAGLQIAYFIYQHGFEEAMEEVDQLIFKINNPTLYMKHKLLPPSPQPHYTVVVDIDDIVKNRKEEKVRTQLLMRPYIDLFLLQLAQRCELILWNASDDQASFENVEKLNAAIPAISSFLSYSECTVKAGIVIKDLTRLNRPLENIILVTSNPQHAVLQPDNAIFVKHWKGNDDDTDLLSIYMFLDYIFESNPQTTDVRQKLKTFHTFDMAEHNEPMMEKYKDKLLESYAAVKQSASQMKRAQSTFIR